MGTLRGFPNPPALAPAGKARLRSGSGGTPLPPGGGTLQVVRRSILLKVAVFCPHFQRRVEATRNEAIDRLVACSDSESCRAPTSTSAAGTPEHDRPYPRGCPVFPSLAK
jgi:hypothetical protein